jgi:tetratricopeptide (TPR) repeat protein
MFLFTLILSRLVPLLLLLSVCLVAARFLRDRVAGRSALVATAVFWGLVILGPALALPSATRSGLLIGALQAYLSGRWEAADRQFALYAQKGGDVTPSVQFGWGISLMNLRLWKEADGVLMSGMNPDVGTLPPKLADLVGMCRYYEGRLADAARALRVSRDSSNAYLRDYFLGRIGEQQDTGEAIVHYERSLSRLPHFYPAAYQAIRLHLQKGDRAAASGILDRFRRERRQSADDQTRARSLQASIDGREPIPPAREFLIVQR